MGHAFLINNFHKIYVIKKWKFKYYILKPTTRPSMQLVHFQVIFEQAFDINP
jgi:hypothetical protein